jgi:hypothetical protein
MLRNVRASGEKGATARVLRSIKNGRHLINYQHCLQGLRIVIKSVQQFAFSRR